MTKWTPLIIGLLAAASAVPAPSQTADAHDATHACVALKPGNPRISDSIGIVFGDDVSRRIVEDAVEHWSRCHGYRTDFPQFLIGQPGMQTITVEFGRNYKRQARCGSFVGRTIVLYAFAVDGKGRVRSCGSRADGLAHELGHVLGLMDAPHERPCFDHAMAPIDVTDRNRRQIQPEECAAVGRRWMTLAEHESTQAVLMAANQPER